YFASCASRRCCWGNDGKFSESFHFRRPTIKTQVRFGSQSRRCPSASENEPNEQTSRTEVMKARLRSFWVIDERMTLRIELKLFRSGRGIYDFRRARPVRRDELFAGFLRDFVSGLEGARQDRLDCGTNGLNPLRLQCWDWLAAR